LCVVIPSTGLCPSNGWPVRGGEAPALAGQHAIFYGVENVVQHRKNVKYTMPQMYVRF
jgi:hypothetical protein